MKQTPAPGSDGGNSPEPGGDPWAAFGYLVAGVAFYGAAGWGLSVWLHAGYWIPIGILVGAGFGLYLVFARTLLRTDSVAGDSNIPSTYGTSGTSQSDPAPHESPDEGDQASDLPDAARNTRPASDDRGETA